MNGERVSERAQEREREKSACDNTAGRVTLNLQETMLIYAWTSKSLEKHNTLDRDHGDGTQKSVRLVAALEESFPSPKTAHMLLCVTTEEE